MKDDDLAEENQMIWAMYFASICGFRFHPKNDDNMKNVPTTLTIAWAGTVADQMLAEHRKRFPWVTGPQ